MRHLARSIALVATMSAAGPAIAETLHATLYKDLNCPCCEGHARYLRAEGMDVEIKAVANRAEINADAGIPSDLEGCHTILLDGYAIEGHVTIEIIERLLAERPVDVVGISLPGMPLGVPGMGGEKTEPYDVLAIKKDGTATVFATQ